jgi:Uma2 family endonuclease
MATNPSRDTENPSWPRSGKRMSEEAYHELEKLSPDRKYEYIDGVAYMMSGGSVAHDLIGFNMRALLAQALRGKPCRAFGPDVQVLVEVRKNGTPQYFYPDTTVSCNPADSQLDNTLIEFPRLVVEVLSPGTEPKDRGIKFKAYQQRPTIQEIVLVNQFAQHVEIWQRNEQEPDNPKAWFYRHYEPGDTIDLVSIDVHISIDDLYQDLNFIENEPEDENE